jgi:hypothetical protein
LDFAISGVKFGMDMDFPSNLTAELLTVRLSKADIKNMDDLRGDISRNDFLTVLLRVACGGGISSVPEGITNLKVFQPSRNSHQVGARHGWLQL